MRAGRVVSFREALQSAKIGEAHGYRDQTAVPVVPPVMPTVHVMHAESASADNTLQTQIDVITKRLDNIASHQTEPRGQTLISMIAPERECVISAKAPTTLRQNVIEMDMARANRQPSARYVHNSDIPR